MPSRTRARRQSGSPGNCCAPLKGLARPRLWTSGCLTGLSAPRDHLVSQAPGVAAELFTQAVSSTPFGAPRHDWLVSRLADALYRSGDIAEAARVASQALAYITEP